MGAKREIEDVADATWNTLFAAALWLPLVAAFSVLLLLWALPAVRAQDGRLRSVPTKGVFWSGDEVELYERHA